MAETRKWLRSDGNSSNSLKQDICPIPGRVADNALRVVQASLNKYLHHAVGIPYIAIVVESSTKIMNGGGRFDMSGPDSSSSGDLPEEAKEDSLRLYQRKAEVQMVREALVRRPCPVLVFYGPRGIGKTEFLSMLEHLSAQRIPWVRIDCGKFSWEASKLLALLAFQLNRHCSRYGRIPFPRLITGLIAKEASLGELPLMADRSEARKQIRKTLEERKTTRQTLDQTVTSVADALGTVVGGAQPAVIAAIKLAKETGSRALLGGLSATRIGRRILLGTGQDWYGHRDESRHEDPLDALVDLTYRLAHPENEKEYQEAERWLWQAFLADLRHAFARLPAVLWNYNCLVLLDNADTPTAQKFLSALTAARAERRRDPLTVVATSRGELVKALTDGASAEAWDLKLLPPLSPADVWSIAAEYKLELGSDAHGISRTVCRYAEGNPVVVREILKAAGERKATGLAEVLPRRLSEDILSPLLGSLSTEAVEDLVTCSAARDRETARGKMTRQDMGLLTCTTGSEIFGRAYWIEGSGDGEPVVLYPPLRRLLLNRLAGREDDPGRTWEAVHGKLREMSRDAGDTRGELYHALALRKIEDVSRALARELEASTADSWLELLESVTAAPNKLDPSLLTVDGVSRLTSWASRQEMPVHPVARLTAAMWINSDPLSDSYQEGLCREARNRLYEAASYCNEGADLIGGYADGL